MPPGYEFQIIENCLQCPLKTHRVFCHLPDETIKDLQRIKTTSIYPKGALLCLEGEEPAGVFILCRGRVKESTTSTAGKTIILRIVDPGDVLGLTAAVSGSAYEATAETLEPSQADFIPRRHFVRFLEEHPDAETRVVQQLTRSCQCAYEEIRCLGLSSSVAGRVARLILGWAENPLHPSKKQARQISICVRLTHEEIAQLTGTSRETISRILGSFKKRRWLRVEGTTWTILNKTAFSRLSQPVAKPASQTHNILCVDDSSDMLLLCNP